VDQGSRSSLTVSALSGSRGPERKNHISLFNLHRCFLPIESFKLALRFCATAAATTRCRPPVDTDVKEFQITPGNSRSDFKHFFSLRLRPGNISF
jgi:hypothetical protein